MLPKEGVYNHCLVGHNVTITAIGFGMCVCVVFCIFHVCTSEEEQKHRSIIINLGVLFLAMFN